jgi:Flp pilus assembly protein TadB
MARKVIERIKAWIYPNHQDGIVRINWLIFAFTAPFLGFTLHQSWVAWSTVGVVGLWAFTFSNAYLNRLYYRNYLLQNQNLQEMLDQIARAYFMLHEHCPNCGSRLKPPPEVRQ